MESIIKKLPSDKPSQEISILKCNYDVYENLNSTTSLFDILPSLAIFQILKYLNFLDMKLFSLLSKKYFKFSLEFFTNHSLLKENNALFDVFSHYFPSEKSNIISTTDIVQTYIYKNKFEIHKIRIYGEEMYMIDNLQLHQRLFLIYKKGGVEKQILSKYLIPNITVSAFYQDFVLISKLRIDKLNLTVLCNMSELLKIKLNSRFVSAFEYEYRFLILVLENSCLLLNLNQKEWTSSNVKEINNSNDLANFIIVTKQISNSKSKIISADVKKHTLYLLTNNKKIKLVDLRTFIKIKKVDVLEQYKEIQWNRFTNSLIAINLSVIKILDNQGFISQFEIEGNEIMHLSFIRNERGRFLYFYDFMNRSSVVIDLATSIKYNFSSLVNISSSDKNIYHFSDLSIFKGEVKEKLKKQIFLSNETTFLSQFGIYSDLIYVNLHNIKKSRDKLIFSNLDLFKKYQILLQPNEKMVMLNENKFLTRDSNNITMFSHFSILDKFKVNQLKLNCYSKFLLVENYLLMYEEDTNDYFYSLNLKERLYNVHFSNNKGGQVIDKIFASEEDEEQPQILICFYTRKSKKLEISKYYIIEKTSSQMDLSTIYNRESNLFILDYSIMKNILIVVCFDEETYFIETYTISPTIKLLNRSLLNFVSIKDYFNIKFLSPSFISLFVSIKDNYSPILQEMLFLFEIEKLNLIKTFRFNDILRFKDVSTLENRIIIFYDTMIEIYQI